jgi:hypothetical protein
VPVLVLLYFLKLKRRQQLVSSTLLWKRAVQDLQVNAPFQRLRRNILLLLQLIALVAILVALARPVLSLNTEPPRRIVILIDQSASMRATDVAPSRLAEAQDQARRLVDTLREGRWWQMSADADQAMVIAMAGHAKVLSTYTADKAQLKAAIDSIEPTDGPTLLVEALTVARAFASSAGVEDKGRSAEAQATLELFSDGRIADLTEVAPLPGEIKFHAIGKSEDNVAVVALQARRAFDQPEKLTVFADLANGGTASVTCDVQLSIDGDVRSVQKVTLPPREVEKADKKSRPSHTAATFQLLHPGAGVLEVRILHDDPLMADNAAWAVLQPPRTLAVALVTEGNTALRAALKACSLAKLDILKPAEFDKLQGPDAAGDIPYDLVVLDRYAPAKLARSNYLVFGPPPAASGAKAVGELKNQVIADWRSRHPLMNFVNMENVIVSRAWKLDLPRGATVLAEFEDSPAVAEVRVHGNVYVLVGFDPLASNWPFDAGFVMFCYNVAAYITSEASDTTSASLPVGQPITLRSAPGTKEAEVTDPTGARTRVAASTSGVVNYGATGRAGVYRLAVDGGAARSVAVNLLDAAESDIGPADVLVTAGQEIKAEAGRPGGENQEVWPLLVLLAMLVACVEWYVYMAKIRL